jgi:hypothetical protein
MDINCDDTVSKNEVNKKKTKKKRTSRKMEIIVIDGSLTLMLRVPRF